MKLSVDEYRALIAARATDIADLANGSRGYGSKELGAALSQEISRLKELADGYDEAVADAVKAKVSRNRRG